jgi:hypothetical protein
MNALRTLSSTKKSGHVKGAKKATESTVVVILTLSIFTLVLIALTVMTLALGSGG